MTGRWHITTRWVGSLVPSEWMEGREYSAAGSDLSVGDLVVVPRTDGTLRFGEVVSIDASRICQVLQHCIFSTSSAHVLLSLHPSQSPTCLVLQHACGRLQWKGWPTATRNGC